MEWFEVTCPYCYSDVEVDVDPETEGSFVQDCSVCCRPWQLRVIRSEDGETRVEIEGALG